MLSRAARTCMAINNTLSSRSSHGEDAFRLKPRVIYLKAFTEAKELKERGLPGHEVRI